MSIISQLKILKMVNIVNFMCILPQLKIWKKRDETNRDFKY